MTFLWYFCFILFFRTCRAVWKTSPARVISSVCGSACKRNVNSCSEYEVDLRLRTEIDKKETFWLLLSFTVRLYPRKLSNCLLSFRLRVNYLCPERCKAASTIWRLSWWDEISNSLRDEAGKYTVITAWEAGRITFYMMFSGWNIGRKSKCAVFMYKNRCNPLKNTCSS